MLTRSVLLTAALAIGLSFVFVQPSADAQESMGRCKLHRVSKGPVEGKVTLDADVYIIELDNGATMRLKKSEVVKLERLAEKPADAEAGATAGNQPFSSKISDEMIKQVLGSESFESTVLDPEDFRSVDARSPLPLDQPSLQEMLHIAGPKGKPLETDHFVFVYTSSVSMARELAARLESVYEWNVRYAEMLKIPIVRPMAKLEIFFFGTFDEYMAYQAINGMRVEGAIGFYSSTVNRSAFFDMYTYIAYEGVQRALKDPKFPGDRKAKLKAWLDRTVEHENVEVVQHEAAHHIHFNLGIFHGYGRPPRWMSEGLATIFEVPPSEFGASFGATNHYRLMWFRRFMGDRSERLGDLRQIMFDDGWFFQFGFLAYSFGWAMNHYLFRTQRENYAKWMQFLATREWGGEWEVADKQKVFEDIFGELNDDWKKKFTDWIASLELKTEHLPPDNPPP
ncbi:MAG: DUF1570 domain-containing protein [Phycisphaerae bacterium]